MQNQIRRTWSFTRSQLTQKKMKIGRTSFLSAWFFIFFLCLLFPHNSERLRVHSIHNKFVPHFSHFDITLSLSLFFPLFLSFSVSLHSWFHFLSHSFSFSFFLSAAHSHSKTHGFDLSAPKFTVHPRMGSWGAILLPIHIMLFDGQNAACLNAALELKLSCTIIAACLFQYRYRYLDLTGF